MRGKLRVSLSRFPRRMHLTQRQLVFLPAKLTSEYACGELVRSRTAEGVLCCVRNSREQKRTFYEFATPHFYRYAIIISQRRVQTILLAFLFVERLLGQNATTNIRQGCMRSGGRRRVSLLMGASNKCGCKLGLRTRLNCPTSRSVCGFPTGNIRLCSQTRLVSGDVSAASQKRGI